MVPRYAELQRSTLVNVVLKADQPTGKLTSGKIAEILTKGDHPRGVKVRLQDGQIGRVQSLAARNSGTQQATVAGFSSGTSSNAFPALNSSIQEQTSGQARRTQDPPKRPAPLPGSVYATSLESYIKPAKSQTQPAFKASLSVQEQLEKTFPHLDSALIAAILVDYPEMQDARDILKTLDSS
ncbi:MAG: hypothetical protein LQ338_002561 [Usnochroma carphineum]|nr:MAG: hypothetical protein LQ338_002561 [Usnochroma carphineum]